MKTKVALFVAFLVAGQIGFSQGFANLNFEDANLLG
jgi:hypothetical protein